MKNSNKRRHFLKTIGSFSALCLLGTTKGFADVSSSSEGFIISKSQGELRYIGKSKSKVLIKISKTSDYTPEISLLSEALKKGRGIPVHKHLNEDEFIFVQKGTIQVSINNQSTDATPGDIIYIPKGVWHGFNNIGNEDGLIFFGYSPAGFEDYFRSIGTTDLETDLQFTADERARNNDKYGVVYK